MRFCRDDAERYLPRVIAQLFARFDDTVEAKIEPQRIARFDVGGEAAANGFIRKIGWHWSSMELP